MAIIDLRLEMSAVATPTVDEYQPRIAASRDLIVEASASRLVYGITLSLRTSVVRITSAFQPRPISALDRPAVGCSRELDGGLQRGGQNDSWPVISQDDPPAGCSASK